MTRRAAACALALVLTSTFLLGCTDETGGDGTADDRQPSTGIDELVLTTDDLPAGFTASADVDDSLTSFCATEDAAAGLQASDRAVAGFRRDAGGASVIQLVFRFHDDGASTFVEQAEGALTRCSGVPDVSGLAFEYEALSAELHALVEGAGDARASRFGRSVGSGNLTEDLLVLQHGDVGILVAVLGLELPRAELDELAGEVFTSVIARL